MNRVHAERYTLQNLDCAACAAKIERELQTTEGVEEAVVDFANLTLRLKARDIQKALDAVARVEPDVIFRNVKRLAQAQGNHQPDAAGFKKQIGILALAVLLFVVHLFFEHQLPRFAWDWAQYATAMAAYLLAGWSVLAGALRTMRRGQFFDEKVLMVIATAGAIAIHALSEAIGVMLFFKVGELLQALAVSKSRRSVRAVLAARPDRALVKTGEGYREVAPTQVKIGDVILVKPGEKVPLDGEVLEGNSLVDPSPLTGEPVPVSIRPGDKVMAGTINTASALTVRATQPFEASSIARILELVENASARKAVTEKFITTFARYYTPVVVAAAAAIAFLPPLVIADAQFSTWIYRALVLLVISCPCALVISIPLGYFGGIGRASRNGILVKGSMFLDALANLKTVVFDKTGTLTRGVFTVDRVVTANGYTSDQILRYAAAAELHSNHPIGKSILEALKTRGLAIDESLVTDHVALSGQGVKAVYNGRDIAVGNDGLLHKRQIDHGQCDFDSTVAHVVVDHHYAGYILIGDRIKPDAKQAMERLRANGVVNLVMLTGDNRCAGESVAKFLDLDDFHAELLPEDKVRLFEEIHAKSRKGEKVAFVGDGINDAPVLARADVGVAMGALGADAAIETADVVLMTDSPMKMAEAIQVARRTRTIVWQNIVMALSIKMVFVALGTMGLASMWEAVFADMGVALAAILNSMRVLRGS